MRRFATALALCGLATAACGARVGDDLRQQAVSDEQGVSRPASTAPSPSRSAAARASSSPASPTESSAPAPSRAGTTTATGWTAVPAGGNGGATDTGVTASAITLATVADRTGPVPDVHADAALAVRAYVAYFTQRFGTVYGRSLRLVELDSRTDAGETRTATQRACRSAFAAVGSASLFDAAAASTVEDCRLPDLRATASSPEIRAVANAYPLEVQPRADLVSLRRFGWAAERFPDAVTKAAYVHPDTAESNARVEAEMAATEELMGYRWVADVRVSPTEVNSGVTAQRLKAAGARYVAFEGRPDQAASLARSLRSAGWTPQVFAPDATAYDAGFLEQAGEALAGGWVYVGVSSAVVEEIADNDALQLYAQWLRRVAPDARPTVTGQRAWGAAALLVQQLVELGPRPTRAGFLALMPQVRAFTAGGLFAPEDVGGKRPSDCVAVLRAVSGRFVRFTPSGTGYRCGEDGLWDVAAARHVTTARR